MKRALLIVFIALSCSAFAAQTSAPKHKASAANTQLAQNSKTEGSGSAKSATTSGGLEAILNKMDETAKAFSSAQADLEADNYSKVVDEHDTQKGVIYYRKSGKGVEMAIDFAQPEKRQVLFSEGNVQLYEPKIDQVTKYAAGKNRTAMESFLLLGFGGRGHDLPKQFDVKYAGTENVGGVNAAKLELVPRQASVKNMFSLITLWIDPARGVSVQQKLLDEKSGDYRLAKYSNIKLNTKVSDSAFKLRTTSKTKVVSPQS